MGRLAPPSPRPTAGAAAAPGDRLRGAARGARRAAGGGQAHGDLGPDSEGLRSEPRRKRRAASACPFWGDEGGLIFFY